ncbi:ribosomal protein S6 modification protein [Legionella beliardensis]|uniref:Ribosomal protein S6 modification protein n=1 Tax=Legionella beliardensis TaxID=91822 RepID=A0A378HXV5_9GAMM|nr:RimK family alpha-L-glutamate ligase [Legionella beliardensis]STX27719.1 ribosomal protein S6 modification protein [Legionella beliardensis]
MKGWVLYKRNKQELTATDHGVNRFLAVAKQLKIDLDVFKPGQFELIVANQYDKTVLLDGKVAALPDFIMPRLGAETPYHALNLIRQLELLGVCCINNAEAIETVKDKMRMGQLLVDKKLPVPKTMALNIPVPFELVAKEIGYPLVIKNIASARGIGVLLCESANSFQDLIGLLSLQANPQLIIQQFIASSYGRDLRVFVLGQEVIGCMQRLSKSGFKANYSLGGEVLPFDLTPEIKHLALECTKIANLDIAGIDLLFGENGYLVCEANSSPGFKGMELATGEDIATKIMQYIVAKVEKFKH